MTKEAILAALRVSLGNPEALTALALIELCYARGSACSQKELSHLIDKWGQTLAEIGPADRERLKRQLRECPR